MQVRACVRAELDGRADGPVCDQGIGRQAGVRRELELTLQLLEVVVQALLDVEQDAEDTFAVRQSGVVSHHGLHVPQYAGGAGGLLDGFCGLDLGNLNGPRHFPGG